MTCRNEIDNEKLIQTSSRNKVSTTEEKKMISKCVEKTPYQEISIAQKNKKTARNKEAKVGKSEDAFEDVFSTPLNNMPEKNDKVVLPKEFSNVN